jgi:hypothetical protein
MHLYKFLSEYLSFESCCNFKRGLLRTLPNLKSSIQDFQTFPRNCCPLVFTVWQAMHGLGTFEGLRYLQVVEFTQVAHLPPSCLFPLPILVLPLSTPFLLLLLTWVDDCAQLTSRNLPEKSSNSPEEKGSQECWGHRLWASTEVLSLGRKMSNNCPFALWLRDQISLQGISG